MRNITIPRYANLRCAELGHDSFIPNWHTEPIDYALMPRLVIPPIKVSDVARDGFHYGINTHRMIAQQFTTLLAAG